MAKFRTRRGRGRGWTCEFERDRAKEGRKERKKGRSQGKVYLEQGRLTPVCGPQVGGGPMLQQYLQCGMTT